MYLTALMPTLPVIISCLRILSLCPAILACPIGHRETHSSSALRRSWTLKAPLPGLFDDRFAGLSVASLQPRAAKPLNDHELFALPNEQHLEAIGLQDVGWSSLGAVGHEVDVVRGVTNDCGWHACCCSSFDLIKSARRSSAAIVKRTLGLATRSQSQRHMVVGFELEVHEQLELLRLAFRCSDEGCLDLGPPMSLELHSCRGGEEPHTSDCVPMQPQAGCFCSVAAVVRLGAGEVGSNLDMALQEVVIVGGAGVVRQGAHVSEPFFALSVGGSELCELPRRRHHAAVCTELCELAIGHV